MNLTPETLIRNVRLRGMAKKRISKKVFEAKTTDHGTGLSVHKCEHRILNGITLDKFRECNSEGLDVVMGVCFVTVEQVAEINLAVIPDRRPPDARCAEFSEHHHCIQDPSKTTLCPDEDAADLLAQQATLNGHFIDAAPKA